jgi:Dual specificity phosphatase, catalytic domain
MPAARTRPRKTATAKSPPSPQEISPGVFLGGWNDALKFSGRRFCVLDDAPDDMPPATHIQIYDDARDAPLRTNLDRLASEVEAARRTNVPVLLFCGHGIRRAPLAAAWYLHRHAKLPLDQAYDRIRAVRPKVESAREWIGDISALDG